jgi:vitamin-K-epoxide reductase (warfarin-sensitive)
MPLALAVRRRLYIVVLLLALVGVGLSAVSLVNHYRTTETEYCSFDETYDCDLVNRSEYSAIAGIPVAGIGIAGYLLLAYFGLTGSKSGGSNPLLLAAALVGCGFALYLTYLEAYVIEAWCILCIASQIVIAIIVVLAIPLAMRPTNRNP